MIHTVTLLMVKTVINIGINQQIVLMGNYKYHSQCEQQDDVHTHTHTHTHTREETWTKLSLPLLLVVSSEAHVESLESGMRALVY